MKKVVISLLSMLVVWAVYWGIYSLTHSHDIFGTNDYIPWGVLISGYTFLVGVSIGCCFIGSLSTVFGIKEYMPIAKKAFFLSIVIVMVGMSIIFVELGRPFRMFLYYLQTPNLTSPIFWMGVNYTIYLLFVVLEFIYLVKNDRKLFKVFGFFAFTIAIIAEGSVGLVFGFILARPFWYGPFFSIDFILTSWISGYALMLIVTLFTEISDDKKSQLLKSMKRWLIILLIINMFFIFWKIMTGLYVNDHEKYMPITALVNGPLSFRFWGIEVLIGLIIPFVLLIISENKKLLMLSSIFIMIGLFVNKIDIIEAGQIVLLQAINYESYINYSFSIPEIVIVLGAIAFLILLYFIVNSYHIFRDILQYKES